MSPLSGDFDGKTALAVCASVGIGAAAARLFSELGASVVLASRNADATQATSAWIASARRPCAVSSPLPESHRTARASTA